MIYLRAPPRRTRSTFSPFFSTRPAQRAYFQKINKGPPYVQCVHSYLTKCREVVLRLSNLFLKISLFELKFHIANIFLEKVLKSENF